MVMPLEGQVACLFCHQTVTRSGSGTRLCATNVIQFAALAGITIILLPVFHTLARDQRVLVLLLSIVSDESDWLFELFSL